ncbi:hypothetical protein SAFG77S_09989 [Streptomyces afghaniensis]
MAISVFDLFSIGIGPSSSHTVGPMRAARMFTSRLEKEDLLARTASVRAELFGSLGATGHGHGTPKAVLLGLEGNEPHTVDVGAAERDVERIRATGRLRLLGRELGDTHEIRFDAERQLVLHRRRSLPYHANGMRLFAYDAEGLSLLEATYYSVGGGLASSERGRGRCGPGQGQRHGGQVPVRQRRRAAAPDPGDGSVDLGADAGEPSWTSAPPRRRSGRNCWRSGG